MTRLHLMFALMCLIWGLTWIAMKAGVTVVPPLFFAASRFTTAGAILLLWLAATGRPVVPARGDGLRVLLAAIFLTVVTYAFIFWGIRSVPSGLAAMVNLALIPIGLYAIGLALGTERLSLRQSVAILLGLAGLAVLFGPEAAAGFEAELIGIIAVIIGTMGYCWGSFVARPLMRRHSALQVSGLTTFIGGVLLLLLSLVLEPVTTATLPLYLRPEVLAGWAFLTVFGSLVAFTIYLRLLQDWGATRASMYAFVTPIVAGLAGAAVFGERFGPREITGMAVLFAATWLALRAPAAPLAARADDTGS